MPVLICAFAVTALLYASAGFGGGSTYAALLAVSGLDYRVLPMVALSCNILVVLGSTIRFARARLVPWRRAAILIMIAAPLALLGGLTPMAERTFFAVLGAGLLLTGAALLVPVRTGTVMPSRYVFPSAAPLGYLAGLTGIGGGIFLAPLLHFARWDKPRKVAATASVFILVNSVFGLAGQVLKGGSGRFAAAVEFGLPLFVAVAIGGQVGSLLAARLLPSRWIRIVTAVLVAAVGVRLLLLY